jgi:hypothetical protein
MSTYTKITDYASKDALLTGNPSKIIKGTEIGAEFDSIAAADSDNLKASAATGTGVGVRATSPTITSPTLVTPTLTTPIVDSLNGGQLAGFRNRIINGDMRVAQRGSTAAVNGAVTYGQADRMACNPFGFTTMPAGNIIQLGGAWGANFSSGLCCALFGATTTGSGQIVWHHRIESLNSFSLNGKTITVSIKAYQSTGGSLIPEFRLYKANSSDNFSAVTQIGSSAVLASLTSGAYTSYSASFTLGATDASNGIQISFAFSGVGAITTKDFIIGDWQLEVGSVATPFEQRPIGTELALCQRYYQILGAGPQGLIVSGYGAAGGASNITYIISPMRTAPTGTVVGTWAVINCGQPAFGSTGLNNMFYLNAAITALGNFQYQGSATNYVTLSAEL